METYRIKMMLVKKKKDQGMGLKSDVEMEMSVGATKMVLSPLGKKI